MTRIIVAALVPDLTQGESWQGERRREEAKSTLLDELCSYPPRQRGDAIAVGDHTTGDQEAGDNEANATRATTLCEGPIHDRARPTQGRNDHMLHREIPIQIHLFEGMPLT